MLAAQLGHLYSRILALASDNIAIAYSGGGDSTALLHMLRDFPGVKRAFIIDHNLRAESEQETQQSAAFAKSLGYQVQTKIWEHDNPKTGVQVKARAYRYAAMGEMCRQTGMTHLLTAHTQDDQAETLLMRQARDTGWRGLAGMREQAYGALWPALAEVTLVRPLLSVSRENLRTYNRREGLAWIDDPSNENRDFTRVCARQKLSEDMSLKASHLKTQAKHKNRLRAERRLFRDWMSKYGQLDSQGYIRVSRVPPSELLLHLLRIASGTGGPIDAARREALCRSMSSPDFKAATLGGAWILNDDDGFLITRDKVAVIGRRGVEGYNIALQTLSKNDAVIWDGRFQIETERDNIKIAPAFGQLQTLRELTDIKELFNLPESVRASLPVYWHKGKAIGFGVGEWGGVKASCLAAKRLDDLWSVD